MVVNDGDGSSEWAPVVPEVLDRVGGSERLVAAVVTGRTLHGTVDAIDSLRKGGVPVIASRLTGDSLTNLDPNQLAALRGGLARVAPTNSDQTVAAAAHLKREASRAVLVQDVKPGDPYLHSLGVAFRRGFDDPTHHVLDPVETYDSEIGGAANTMGAMLRNICQEKPDVVFFAGRTPELGAFIQALPGRPCPETPIKIVAGADSVEFAAEMAGTPELRRWWHGEQSCGHRAGDIRRQYQVPRSEPCGGLAVCTRQDSLLIPVGLRFSAVAAVLPTVTTAHKNHMIVGSAR